MLEEEKPVEETGYTKKQWFIDVADVVDAFRLVPRGLLLASGYLVWHVVNWYMALPTPTTQQAALVTTVTAIIPAVIGLYQTSGRKSKMSGE